MRHNYVGDEGDYAKLALLRALARDQQLGVNWYLTVHEETPKQPAHGASTPQGDGYKLDHLVHPDEWSDLDAALLERMVESLRGLREEERHIEKLEVLLPGADFFQAPLPTGSDSPAERRAARRAWHQTALQRLAGAEIVFVDPDNGFEVKSHGPGSKWRCKYAAYDEVADYLARGQAVVAYQHRPRVTWAELVAQTKAEIAAHGVPTAPLGFIAFGSRGFFLMHRDPAEVKQLTIRAQALKDACDEAGWTKLKIDVIAPEPHAR